VAGFRVELDVRAAPGIYNNAHGNLVTNNRDRVGEGVVAYLAGPVTAANACDAGRHAGDVDRAVGEVGERAK